MSNRLIHLDNNIVPIQSTNNPNEIINPIPLVDEPVIPESISVSPDGEVVGQQIEVLNPEYDPIANAPDDVLASMHEFGTQVANTPSNVPPVRLAGMITVHAVYMERKRRIEASGGKVPDISQPTVAEDISNEPKFQKKYD